MVLQRQAATIELPLFCQLLQYLLPSQPLLYKSTWQKDIYHWFILNFEVV